MTMRMNKARQAWVVIHRWVGLLAGAWLVVVGLSGSFLSFYPEIDRALNPDWSTPQSRGERASEAHSAYHELALKAQRERRKRT